MNNSEFVFKAWIDILNSPEIKKRLLRYAEKQLVRHRIAGRTITADDVISELVIKLAFGKRGWNKKKKPDLYMQLYPLISSFVKNTYDKEKRTLKPAFYGLSDEEYDEVYVDYVDSHSLFKNENTDDEENHQKTMEVCMNLVAADDECGLVILALDEGQTHKEIAEDLCVSLQKINAIMMRAKSKLFGLVVLTRNGKIQRFTV